MSDVAVKHRSLLVSFTRLVKYVFSFERHMLTVTPLSDHVDVVCNRTE